MPTLINFAAGHGETPLGLAVEESPEEVAEALANAGGAPVRLRQRSGDVVYVNPATVAFWQEARSRRRFHALGVRGESPKEAG